MNPSTNALPPSAPMWSAWRNNPPPIRPGARGSYLWKPGSAGDFGTHYAPILRARPPRLPPLALFWQVPCFAGRPLAPNNAKNGTPAHRARSL